LDSSITSGTEKGCMSDMDAVKAAERSGKGTSADLICMQLSVSVL
jgi:hypothetical protein